MKKNQLQTTQKSPILQMVLQTNLEGKQLSSLSNTECAKFISKMLSLVGATDKNAPTEVQFIVENIKQVFGKWTIEEILLAFRFGLEGKIEVDLNLYDKQFGLVYLSNILNAYKKKYRSPELLKYNQGLISAKDPELSKEEIDKKNEESALRFIEKIYNSEDVYNVGYEIAYDYLKAKKILLLTQKQRDKISAEAQDQAMKEQVRENDNLISQGKIREARRMFDKPLNTIMLKKKIAVSEFLQDRKDMDIPLKEVLSES